MLDLGPVLVTTLADEQAAAPDSDPEATSGQYEVEFADDDTEDDDDANEES
mgnify:CR=1 FL=1